MNIAIFVSGNGTNCENIINHFEGSTKVRVALVVSNRSDAYALERARRHGIDTTVVTKAGLGSEAVLGRVLDSHGVDFIVLAGFLLMIPAWLIARYDRRIVNIHPALLPRYGGPGMYGRHVHEAVWRNHEPESGITIHYVSEVCDGGDIIFQASVPLAPGDTPDDIAEKVHRLEMEHYPRVIERLAED